MTVTPLHERRPCWTYSTGNMRPGCYGILLAAVAWLSLAGCCEQAMAGTSERVTITLTADTEGSLKPCRACSTERGWGGLARRATLVAQLRQENSSLLLVDAGNAFFGGESIASGGKVVVSAYNALGYDAVNLSYRDFRLRKAATMALVKEARFAAVSANLLDDEEGKLLLRPYIVKEGGGKRVAVLGVTQEPPGLEFLPHLQEQLAGIIIQPPVEALAEWLPKAKAEADKVILLYYGSASGLAPIREGFGGDLDAILVGAVPPDFLPIDTKPPLIGTGQHGRQLAQVRFVQSGEETKVEVSQLPINPELKPDPEMEKLLARYLKPIAEPKTEVAAKGQPTRASMLPAPWELDRTYPLYSVTSNRAVRLAVSDVAIREKYGHQRPAEGRRFLVMNTEWENIVPLTLVAEREIPTKYLIPKLGDHLYLVVNGQRACRLRPDAGDLPGHVPVAGFGLERIGSKLRGNVLFEVPADALDTLELRFYDYAHGHMTIPLMARTSGSAADEEEPVLPLQTNQFLEMGVYGMTKSQAVNGQEAPAGMVFVAIDLRARSLFTFETDATAFDPKAEEGELMEIGTVADWKDSDKYLHLVADGEYAYAPARQTALSEEPRFLPDVMTGDRVVFLAPQEARSLELRCDFPNAQAPGKEKIIHPKPITFLLEGRPARLGRRSSIASIKDDVIDVHVTGQEVVSEFAGEEPARNMQFLVLDVTLTSTRKKGEFFQTEEQLHCVGRDGDEIDMDKVTYRGIRRPSRILWIPGKQQRSFQAVFKLPKSETKPRLAYHGYSLAKVVKLRPLED